LRDRRKALEDGREYPVEVRIQHLVGGRVALRNPRSPLPPDLPVLRQVEGLEYAGQLGLLAERVEPDRVQSLDLRVGEPRLVNVARTEARALLHRSKDILLHYARIGP
jgi:hypothetical protein